MRSNGHHNSTNAPPTDWNSQRMHAGFNGFDGFDVRKKLKFVKNEEEVPTFIQVHLSQDNSANLEVEDFL